PRQHDLAVLAQLGQIVRAEDPGSERLEPVAGVEVAEGHVGAGDREAASVEGQGHPFHRLPDGSALDGRASAVIRDAAALAAAVERVDRLAEAFAETP